MSLLDDDEKERAMELISANLDEATYVEITCGVTKDLFTYTVKIEVSKEERETV
jgi:hypothetical protein